MSTGELLNVDPLELKFPFELKKQISCSLQLSNKTDNHVAFKVKTTNPKKYCVRPNTGLVMSRSTCDVIVTMQAQKEAPADMTCKDKFLLQSVVAPQGVAAKDITPEMFSKQAGRVVEECKLKVIYLPPPQPPSPVLEEPDEGVSPKVSFTDSGHSNTSSNLNTSVNLNNSGHLNTSANLNSSENLKTSGNLITSRNLNISEVSRKYVDSDDNSLEVKSLISELTNEKNAAVQKSNKIRQEMEMLMRGGNKSQGGGVPIIFVIAMALIGLVIGFLMNN